MAVLEAGTSGIPVVATNAGGTGELVADGESGILVAPRSPSQIADAVLRLLNSPEQAQAMGRKAAERARELFSLERCIAEHACLYREVLGSTTVL